MRLNTVVRWPVFSGEALRIGFGVALRAIALLLSERERCSYRTPMTDRSFLAHFNLWWARHGWPLIHLAARPDGQFSRPPYLTAAVNLAAEPLSEPPRGGEHGAGVDCLYLKKPIRGIPKLFKL